ncbi:ATP-binding protein [Archangium gephyra]|uniref:ATP-binding protein n=1 Tax=Archangium gephyra TaxID=48 RepID=UPI0035D4536D
MLTSPSQPSASLARATLLKMGVRIAVVIALTTLVSYFHMLRTLRGDALQQMERHVVERSQREQAIFLLAEDNHGLMKTALRERIVAWSQQDPNPRFDSLFTHLPDGSVRSRAEGFDGTRMVSVFVPKGVSLDLGLRRRILAAYDVVAQYGPAFSARFMDTYITLAEGPAITFWPGHPNWSLEIPADFSSLGFDYYTMSLPEQNPGRRTTWSGIFLDPTTQSWMVTVTTPLDMDGRQVASFGHDVLLDDLMTRSIKDHLPNAYNLLVRDDGQLIAHPELELEGATVGYDLHGTGASTGEGRPPRFASEAQRAHLRALFERVKNRQPGEVILELPEFGEYLAVARLRGPEWNFVTVLPQSVVSGAAFSAARYVLLFGVASLVLELLIMAWVLQREISRPLQSLTRAAHSVAAGDFQVELGTARGDELGVLAGAFRMMADKVKQREEELRMANESLEQRVEERTRELKEVHQQLVRTARQAGMAEIATNVLHNVGNVLNSVYTSAQLAKERLERLRLEQVGRVATLLEERQTELSTFLTQDERGRNMMPFLRRLGQNLLEERQELYTLLDDVGRYTEHIGDIVKVQQTHARTPRLNEPVSLEALVEDALRINAAGLLRHQVKEERRLTALPPVLTDRHKVLMILVNLVSNAKYAMDETPVEQRLLRVTLERVGTDRVRIDIRDQGLGIPPEMRTRIFQYGFTTRDGGHGFGLHSSALAAQELGGSLTAHSDGPGQGATFTLELPFHPAEQAPTP